MKQFTLLLVVLSLFAASPVMAAEQFELETTRYLYDTCKNAGIRGANTYNAIYCRTFINGAMNAHVHLTSTYNFPRQYCLPLTNVEAKIAGIFMKYVEEHPQYLNKPAIINLYYALHGAFPCPEPTTTPAK